MLFILNCLGKDAATVLQLHFTQVYVYTLSEFQGNTSKFFFFFKEKDLTEDLGLKSKIKLSLREFDTDAEREQRDVWIGFQERVLATRPNDLCYNSVCNRRSSQDDRNGDRFEGADSEFEPWLQKYVFCSRKIRFSCKLFIFCFHRQSKLFRRDFKQDRKFFIWFSLKVNERKVDSGFDDELSSLTTEAAKVNCIE